MQDTRPLSASLAEVTISPSFLLSTPDMAPRALWACHPVAEMISSIVAPMGAFSISISKTCFVPSRRVGGFGFGVSAASLGMAVIVRTTTGSIPMAGKLASVTVSDAACEPEE